MEKLFLTSRQRKNIAKNKKKIEDELNVKISLLKGEVLVEGNATQEYVAARVIDALNFGFELKLAMLLKDEEYMLEIIHIKDYVKNITPNRLRQIKARIIGKKGKAIENIMNLSDSAIKLQNNTLAILGRTENVKIASSAVISLIGGSEHANVYTKIEKIKTKGLEEDLGLKL